MGPTKQDSPPGLPGKPIPDLKEDKTCMEGEVAVPCTRKALLPARTSTTQDISGRPWQPEESPIICDHTDEDRQDWALLLLGWDKA
jgi:hypothetical protein